MSHGPLEPAKLVAALVLIAIIAVAWLVAGPHEGTPVEEPEAAAGMPGSRPRQVSDASRSASRSAVVAGQPRAASRPADSEPVFGIVRGRIVAAEDGRPLAGARISVSGAALDELTSGTRADLQSPAPSGDDGRFELRLPVPARLVRSMEIRCEGRITKSGLPVRWHTGDLGDLPLERGFAVRGSVADMTGVPVGGVRVKLEGAHAGGHLGLGPHGEVLGSATSDRQGAFAMEDLLPAGRWRVVVEDPMRIVELVHPRFVDVQADSEVRDLRVTVDRKPSTEGTIVDEDGAPMEIGIMASDGDQNRIGAGLAIDGSFAVGLNRSATPLPVRLSWWPDFPAGREVETQEWFEWGARNVRLVAKRLPAIELQVFAADTGAPVEEYGVITGIVPESPFAEPGIARTRSRSWPGGRARVERFISGSASVRIVPRRPEFLVSERVWIDAKRDGGPVRIGLARSTKFTLRVLRGDRSPVAGALVELIRVERGSTVSHESAVTDERSWLESSGWSEGNHTLIAFGITDEGGRVGLHGDAPGAAFALRVRSPVHAPLLVEHFFVPLPDTELAVLVADGAGLDVSVTPVSIATLDGAGIVLRRQGANPVWFPGRREHAPLEWDGSARLRCVPAGTWDVLLGHAGGCVDSPLATVSLADGETAHVELALPHFVPARVRGTVTWRGAPPWSGTAVLFRQTEGKLATETRVVLDRTGGFVAEDLLPGRYQARAAMYTGEGHIDATCPEVFDLTAGTELTRVFDQWRKN